MLILKPYNGSALYIMDGNKSTSKIDSSLDLRKFSRHFTLFFLTATLAFGLGWLASIESKKTPVTIEYDFSALPESMRGESISFTEEIGAEKGVVVGSKNGSVYHLPWCPGAQQMNEENKIWFESRKEAEEAGYRPAQNCKGL